MDSRFRALIEYVQLTPSNLAKLEGVSSITILAWIRKNEKYLEWYNSSGKPFSDEILLKNARHKGVAFLRVKSSSIDELNSDSTNTNRCLICNLEFSTCKALTTHIGLKHVCKNYYDAFLKRESDGICPVCKQSTSFISLKRGYSKFCSVKCGVNSVDTSLKKQKTCLKKYGVQFPNQSDVVKNKRKDTCLEKYGVETAFSSIEVREKITQTLLEKYGGHHSKNEQIKQKKKDKALEKYGVSCTLHAKEVEVKVDKTFQERYGGHPNKNKEVKQKKKNTFFSNRLPEVDVVLSKLSLKLLEPYKKNIKPVHIQCTLCNTVFEGHLFGIQQGYIRCPNCYPKYRSIAETEVLNYIKSLNLNVIENSRKVINPLELDIYISQKSLAVEYNGLYYHSESVSRDKNYHLTKLDLCQQKNINLIQIFEDEWLMHQDIVKARLKQILGVNDSQRIHARLCSIKSITSPIKSGFLNNYHLQGSDNSPVSLGAFHNEQLVAVMTFNHGSLAKGVKTRRGDVWELNRYCCNHSFHIPGIASKLLSFFKKNYEWKTVYSYADRRWSNGNMYYKLGFELDSITKPNYWYVKGFKRIHRFSLRKRADEPKDIPEWMLRMQEGYTRIWDCGNLKFVMEKV